MFLCFSFSFRRYLRFTRPVPFWYSSASCCLFQFHLFLPFFVLHHSYAMRFFFFAVVFGHKPFCWLNICYLVVYLFTLPHPHSLSILSSVFLCCHPPCLFPFSIPIASKLSKLLLSLLLAFVLFPPPPPSRRASHAFSDIAWRWSSSMLSCPA